MASPYSAWADSVTYSHPCLSQGEPGSDTSLPSADPTAAQPFTRLKNVSYSYPGVPASLHETSIQHHTPAANMPKRRHYSNHAAIAPAAPVHNNAAHSTVLAHGHEGQDFACPVVAEHCHFSPPCDKPDCDEATICFDHNAHDFFPCNNDLSWCQEHLKCDDVFACSDACNFDFDCNVFPCPETCHEVECHQPQHALDCNTACATVACSDPQCNEGVLYCCLSDVCPHKIHTDCHPPCPQDCPQVHTHFAAPLPPSCHQPCSISEKYNLSLQDSTSISTISTPQTDPSDAVNTPTSLQFQSLVEAAASQAFVNVSNPDSWDLSRQADSHAPERKRRKLDQQQADQALYESKVMNQTFSQAGQNFQDSWPDYSLSLAADFVFNPPQNTHQPTLSSPPLKSGAPDTHSVPPEGLVCRWQDEITGTCNATFTVSEDFHNHVKEHTSTLVGMRGANRDYKCRWHGCDKTDPFGTKNHLDRHMQNHTGFKPFACTICGHRCVTHQQLTNHMTTHTRSKPFVCDFPGCNKSFSVKTALSTHKRTHTNDKPFACRFCGDKYADSSNLSKHRKTVHEDERTSIPCPENGCTYRDSRCQRLERHCRDSGHGATVYSDPMKWAEYTGKWRRKPPTVRSRTASVARSSISVL